VAQSVSDKSTLYTQLLWLFAALHSVALNSAVNLNLACNFRGLLDANLFLPPVDFYSNEYGRWYQIKTITNSLIGSTSCNKWNSWNWMLLWHGDGGNHFFT